jgi:hypothetical protein
MVNIKTYRSKPSFQFFILAILGVGYGNNASQFRLLAELRSAALILSEENIAHTQV